MDKDRIYIIDDFPIRPDPRKFENQMSQHGMDINFILFKVRTETIDGKPIDPDKAMLLFDSAVETLGYIPDFLNRDSAFAFFNILMKRW